MRTTELALRACSIKAAAGKGRRLRILAYTGGVMTVEGFGPVVIDLAGLELPAELPILADHENRLDAVVGAGAPEVSGGQLFVTATLVESESADRVLSLLQSGAPLAASVGVDAFETRKLSPGEEVNINERMLTVPDTGALLVSKGRLREVSIVALPADDETAVSLAARRAQDGDARMSGNSGTEAHAVAAERERVLRIRDVCADGFSDIEARAIREGWSPEQTEVEVLRAQARRAELEAVRASRPSITGVRTTGGGVAGVPARDVLAAAVLLHAGRADVAERYIGPRAAQAGADLRARSLLDITAAALRLR